MKEAIPSNMSADALGMVKQLTGGQVGEVRVSQTSLFSPDQDIMGQEDKTQESKNGIELAGTHGVDVENVTRLSKESLDGGALVIERKGTAYGQVSRR